MSRFTDLGEALEPLAAQALADEPELETVEVASISIAISLKRIADTLDGTAAGICVTETTCGGRRA